MEIKTAEYVQSAGSVVDLPKANLPEYAFAGRSNVGKSSLINMLCDKKKLAITSSKPGRTQAINHFIINKNWYLVDLPGYGFAKASKKLREKWIKMMKRYFRERENLVAVFVLVDIRVPIMDSDLDFIHMLGENGIPFNIIFTKSDQVKQQEIHDKKQAYCDKLLETWEELPPMIMTSARKGRGRTDILDYIESSNELFLKNFLPEQG
jgi:GTP-binding protein